MKQPSMLTVEINRDPLKVIAFSQMNIAFKGKSRGLEAFKSHMKNSYEIRRSPALGTVRLIARKMLYVKCVGLCFRDAHVNIGWTKGIIPISDHRQAIVQAQYVKGTGGYRIMGSC